jgi:ribosomal protein S21
MSIARVKVIAHRLPSNFHRLSEAEQKVIKRENISSLIKKFRRHMNEAGVMNKYREHQRYEKPSEKKRRIRRQRELLRLKEQRSNNKRRN